MEIFVHIYIQI